MDQAPSIAATDDPQVPDDEKALVKDWKKRIDQAREDNEQRFRQFARNRRYFEGREHADGAAGLVRTNMIFSTIATVLPQTYARDPDLNVNPSEAVDPMQYQVYREFGKTLQSVLKKHFINTPKLKRKMKAASRSSMVTCVGWLKLTFQEDVRSDPQIIDRMNDIQDNLQRIQAMRDGLDDYGEDPELKRAKLQQELEGLAAQAEVVVSRGLAIDKLLSEHVLVLDGTVRDYDDYHRAAALGQVLWYTCEDYESRFGRKPSSKARTYESTDRDVANPPQGKGEKAKYYCVIEIWDNNAKRVYTWCEGEEGWCRPPFTPGKVGKRFHPYFAIMFNPADGRFYGLSDVELLIGLQEEYSQVRTDYAKHRANQLPIKVVRYGGTLAPEDLEKIRNAKSGETVVIGGGAGNKISDDLQTIDHPPVDPTVYDVSQIRADIEVVSGASDASRGNVMKAKTATEASIMEEGLSSRTSERQDHLADVLHDMATYAAEILLQELSVAEVQKVAGPKAVWPVMSKDEVFSMMQLEIVASSMGRQNKTREREQWTALLPIIKDGIMQITQLQMQGMTVVADSLRNLLRETLRRFDERIDVDSYLPPVPTAGPDPMALQSQNMQLGQQLQGAQDQIAQFPVQQAQDQAAAQQADRQHQLVMQVLKMAGDHMNTQATIGAKQEDAGAMQAMMDGHAQMMGGAVNGIGQQLQAFLGQLVPSLQAVAGQGPQYEQTVQALIAALQELTRVTAAPRMAVRDPATDRIVGSQVAVH